MVELVIYYMKGYEINLLPVLCKKFNNNNLLYYKGIIYNFNHESRSTEIQSGGGVR